MQPSKEQILRALHQVNSKIEEMEKYQYRKAFPELQEMLIVCRWSLEMDLKRLELITVMEDDGK